MSFQGDEVFGDLYQEEKKKVSPHKKKSTDILLTINLNEKFVDMSVEQKQRFKDWCKYLFDDKHILDYLTSTTSPESPLDDVDEVDVKWKPEIGPIQGRLHLHAMVAIVHHGFLTFHPNLLREDALDEFGHKVYINAKVSSNQRVKWESYMEKGFQDLREEDPEKGKN